MMTLQELSYVATIVMGLASGLTIVVLISRWVNKPGSPESGKPNDMDLSHEVNGYKADDVEAQK